MLGCHNYGESQRNYAKIPFTTWAFDAGKFGVEAAEGVGELLVVDAEDVGHRGVEVDGCRFVSVLMTNSAQRRCE